MQSKSCRFTCIHAHISSIEFELALENRFGYDNKHNDRRKDSERVSGFQVKNPPEIELLTKSNNTNKGKHFTLAHAHTISSIGNYFVFYTSINKFTAIRMEMAKEGEEKNEDEISPIKSSQQN